MTAEKNDSICLVSNEIFDRLPHFPEQGHEIPDVVPRPVVAADRHRQSAFHVKKDARLEEIGAPAELLSKHF